MQCYIIDEFHIPDRQPIEFVLGDSDGDFASGHLEERDGVLREEAD